MRVAYAAGSLALSALVCGCAAKRPTVLGRIVTVSMAGPGADAKGELISVEDGRLLLSGRDGLREVPLSDVREVRVKRHGWDGRAGLTWASLAGLVTGGALAASCAAVEGNSGSGCLGVGGVTFASWLAVGVVSSLSMERSSWLRLLQPTGNALRPYARFPQGVPPAVDVNELAPASVVSPGRRPSEKPLQLPPAPRQ